MIKNLDKSIGVIGTHPMFGPDSFQSNKELKMMMNKTRDVDNQYSFWRQYFKDQGIQIFEMSAEDHDKKASQTQGVTHFLGRMLKELGIQKTTIDTQGFCDLLDLVDQTCNDSWELFKDLQLYNPYTKEMIKNLKRATEEIDKRLNN
jgi:prephenate dehydrogenase